MRKHRPLTVFLAAFAAVMIGGVAVAAVGGLSPATRPDPGASSGSAALAPRDLSATWLETGTVATTTPHKGGAPDAGGVEPGAAPKTYAPAPKPLSAGTEEPRRDLTPPELVILQPEDGSETHDPALKVAGETEPGALVHLGDRKAEVDRAGHWWIAVELEPGENRLVVTATDEAGNTSRAAVTIFLLVVEPKPAPDWRFTAHQRWEVVDGDPAVNAYWGTAKPGAEVWVGSEHGRGHTTANREGHWELKVEFPTAPCNEPFRVVVESGDHRKEFKMKRACATDHEFTAHQQYGECGETVPYDVFWGTAMPGVKISVLSPYGSGATIAGAEGHWELKVEFPDAPEGKVFEVAIESSDGGRAGFTFVNVGPGG